MKTNCPNCGETLESFRTDRQAAGEREVILYWMICPACRHVALDHWELDKEAVSGGDRAGLHSARRR